jgi:hypothetical protein
VPRNDGRYLKRNALVALGNTGTEEDLTAIEAHADEPMLGDYARWARERIRTRHREANGATLAPRPP